MHCNILTQWILVSLINHYVSSHLIDLGEVNYNWSAIPMKMQPRIVGGQSTNLRQFPSSVQFFNMGGICAGNIVTSNSILTAAHCFDTNKNIAEMTVFSNARYIFDPQARSHQVWDYVINERYNEHIVFANDIAVVLIKGHFKLGPFVKKALLINNQDWMNEHESSFTAAGWGLTEENGTTSSSGLLRTSLRYISQKHCETMSKTILSPDMFCLYGDGKRDTCQGDSGGGVLWKDFVVGLVSHGHGCAQTPSMYVNVYYFRSWIKKQIEELNKKNCRFPKI